MSLETGNYIKDLLDTNPEGTDPKSQGDDHLRLIKHVLKTQFAGLTQGVGIAGKESDFNALTGICGNRLANNIDSGTSQVGFYGIGPATTGTMPPNWANGDVLLSFPWDLNRQYQIYMQLAGYRIWFRAYNTPTWGAWIPLKGLGAQQGWQNFTGLRAFTTQYINDSNQTIQVSVTAQSLSTLTTYMVGFVRGNIVSRVLISDGTVGASGTTQLIVPPGHEYQINLLGGSSAAVQEWMELRPI